MLSRITAEEVLNALRAVQDPDLDRDIVSLGFVKDLEVSNHLVSFTLELGSPASQVKEQMLQTAKQAVMALGVSEVQVKLTFQVSSGKGPKSGLIPQVKNTIAVASG